MDELFRCENVVVRRVAAADERRWVVTFDNYGIGHGFDRLGFGEDFLSAHGISALHVMGRGEDWYQYPEMTEATAAVQTATAGADRIMTYGSSMGGYAALRFADAVGATGALALSPQYSLDPVKVPHDRRWSQEADRIHWLPEIDGPIRTSIKPVVVFDPNGLDGWHGRRVAEDVEIIPIRLPFTRHPGGVFLNEIGLLKPLLTSVLEGVLDGPQFERQVRLARRGSGHYLGELAQRQPTCRRRTALALARHALAIGPDNGHALFSLAKMLTEQGHHDEALTHYRRLLLVTDRTHAYLVPYADALAASGDVEGAAAIAREVIASMPHMAHFQAWAAFIFWTTGLHDEARDAVKRAYALAPSNTHFRELMALYDAEEQPAPSDETAEGPAPEGKVHSPRPARRQRWWSSWPSPRLKPRLKSRIE